MVRTEDEIKKHDLIDLAMFLGWGLVALYGFATGSPTETYVPSDVKSIWVETPNSTVLDSDPVTFSGISPGVSIDMIDDDSWIKTAKVSTDGRWSMTVPLKQVADHLIMLRAKDSAGNQVAQHGPVNYLKSSKPIAPAKPPKVEKPEAGSSLIKGKSTVLGRAAPGEKVKIYANKLLLATTNADTTGKWRVTVNFDSGPTKLSAVTPSDARHTIEFEVH
ncbi:MAG: hypothetical protein ABL962_15430 [Fimbriimonadaceae bacterium]